MNWKAALLVITLALAACARGTAATETWDRSDFHLYRCADGSSLEVQYPDTDTAVIRRGDRLVLLRIERSASGARYVGEGWQWWTKGPEATLAPLASGETIASARGVDCRIGD